MNLHIEDIRGKIEKANALYYHTGGADLRDAEYDDLKEELRRRCPSDPLLTQVGAPFESERGKVRHTHPMGSLENVKTSDAFIKWWDSVLKDYTDARLHFSYKADGSSVSLKFTDGRFQQGVSRGDGEFGEDITANISRIPNVPLRAHINGSLFTGFVRGEVVLPTKTWAKLDQENPSNPRNFGNGMLMSHSGEGCEHLEFLAFRLFDAGGNLVGATEYEALQLMTDMGFKTVTAVGPTEDFIADLVALRSYYEMFSDTTLTVRDNLPYEIDGLVVKVNQFSIQRNMGTVGKFPKSQRAFKFPERGAPTVLKDVIIQMGRTGALTPVAVLEPVRVGGVTIERATLHNFNFVIQKGIAVGDTVLVARMCDVIPGVVGKVSDGEKRKLIKIPTKCPITGGPVGRLTNEDGSESAVLFSLEAANSAPAKIKQLRKWVAELDIQGLGPIYLEALYNADLVKTPADLYRLTADSACDAISPKIMAKVVANIQAKKEIELSKFLDALGVNSLGYDRAMKVRQLMPGEFDTLADWFSGKVKKHAEELKLKGLMKKIGPSLEQLKPIMEDLLKAGVKAHAGKVKGAVTGNCFVLTGEFPDNKDVYHRQIEDAGMSWAPRFTKTTTHVVSMNPHSNTKKCQAAREQGLPIIGLDELLTMITK